MVHLLHRNPRIAGTVRLWRTDTWETLSILHEEGGYIETGGLAFFHPKLPILATLGEKNSVIRIWNIEINKLLGGIPQTKSVQYTTAKLVLVGTPASAKPGWAGG